MVPITLVANLAGTHDATPTYSYGFVQPATSARRIQAAADFGDQLRSTSVLTPKPSRIPTHSCQCVHSVLKQRRCERV